MEQQQQRVIEICTEWDLYENTTEEKQILKFYTELGEYADAVLKDDKDAIIDAIGDMAVCLINAEVIGEKGYGQYRFNIPTIDDLACSVVIRDYNTSFLILSSLAESHGTTLEHCLNTVIKVIEKRKGKMINGVFVKEQSQKNDVIFLGLSEQEFAERERLLELQRSRTRWFSQQEFDRLKELSDKMFNNAGSPNIP